MMKTYFIPLTFSLLLSTSISEAGFNPDGATIEEVDAKIMKLHHKIRLLETTDEKTKTILSQQISCLETLKSNLSLPQTNNDEKNTKQSLINLSLESYAKIKEEKSNCTYKTGLSSALVKPLEIINIPSHVPYPTLEQIEDVFPIKAKAFFKEAINILQNEEKEKKSTEDIPRCKYLTPREARKLFEGNLDDLLDSDSDKEKIKDKVFTSLFFGFEPDEKRLISLWEACLKIFSSKDEINFLGIKSIKGFINHVLDTSALDLFLGSTPEEIEKGYRLCAKSWEQDDSLPLKYFFKKGSDFIGHEQFYNLFGIASGASGFFKSDYELENYWLKNDYGFITRADIQELVSAVKRILHITQEGDILLIFGNTPALLGRILEKIAHSTREILFFPFSGTPNTPRMNSYIEPEDLTTKERQDYFIKTYMHSKGLSLDNPKLKEKTIWLIDLIRSGRGPAYVLESLIAQYHHHEPSPLSPPNVRILALGEIHQVWEKLDSNSPDTRIRDIYRGNARLYFPTIRDIHFSVPVVEMPLECVGKLDSPLEHQRILPAYNAMYWAPEYEDYLKRDHSLYIKMFLSYFDLNVEKILKE